MKVRTILFSPTGGTRKVAEILAAGLGTAAGTIDLTERDGKQPELLPDDLALIAVPSYGGRVPTTALERLGQLDSRGCQAVLVCVYGNRAYDDTLRELQQAAEQAGFRPVAAVAAVAEHSIARQFASGRPDREDTAELQQFAAEIRKALPDPGGSLHVPGNIPARPASGIGMRPKGNRDCTACGTCAEQCPAGAIDPARPRSTDRSCISCMRCVAVCPQNARGLSPLMLKAAGLMLKKALSGRKGNELFLASGGS